MSPNASHSADPKAVSSETHPRDARADVKRHATAIWDYVTSVRAVRKRDGRLEDFDATKLETSIREAFSAAGQGNDDRTASRVTTSALARLARQFDGVRVPASDDIREVVLMAFIDANLAHVAKKYLSERIDRRKIPASPTYGKGVRFNRLYTKPGVHPYELIEWEERDATITNAKGEVVFEQKGIEIPKSYSQTATNIIVSKYFRGRSGRRNARRA